MGDIGALSVKLPYDYNDYKGLENDAGSKATSDATGSKPRDGYGYDDYRRDRSAALLEDGRKIIGECAVPAAAIFDKSGLLGLASDVARGKSLDEASLRFVAKHFAALDHTTEGVHKFLEGVEVTVECDKAFKGVANDGAERQAHYLRNEANEIRQLKLDLDAGLITPAQYDRFTSKMSAPSRQMAAELKPKQFDATEATIAKTALPTMKHDFGRGVDAAYALKIQTPSDVTARCVFDPKFKAAYEGNYEFRVGVDKVVDDYANDRKTFDAGAAARAKRN